jgi:hypothetical protein
MKIFLSAGGKARGVSPAFVYGAGLFRSQGVDRPAREGVACAVARRTSFATAPTRNGRSFPSWVDWFGHALALRAPVDPVGFGSSSKTARAAQFSTRFSP